LHFAEARPRPRPATPAAAVHLPSPPAPLRALRDARVSLGSPSLCRHRLPRRPHLPLLLHPPAVSLAMGSICSPAAASKAAFKRRNTGEATSPLQAIPWVVDAKSRTPL
ncbi:unnamed protein product, partial [Urochloa humidicola]